MVRTTGWEGALEVRVLGSVDARVNGASVDVGGSRQRRLLAVLAVNAGRVVPLDALAEYVWDDDDRPENAVEAIRTYVSRLRRALTNTGVEGDRVVVTEAPGYRLALLEGQLDSSRFEGLIASGSTTDADAPRSALAVLDEAATIWRGRPYAEFADRPWAEAEVARLEALHSVLAEERAAARLELGAHNEVIATLQGLADDDPLRGRVAELLTLALYRSGRQAEALRAAARHRDALNAVGLDPSQEFAELESGVATGQDDLRAPPAGTRSVRGYEIAERIGDGAFSIVYRGVQPSLGREVAVKQIRSELANRPEFIRRFEAEAHLVASLEHPHIVPLYDYWREPGAAFLVMRWLRGGTLESELVRHRLDAQQCVALAGQVGAALEVAHQTGVVHRDVKSANIFLDGAGNYFLGDFGIAVDNSTRHDPEALLSAGSPAYASPEQLRREPVGPQADIHGLGIVVYEALTGQLPFPEEQTQAALLHRQLNDPVPPVTAQRPDLSSMVDEVLARATAKPVDDRYGSGYLSLVPRHSQRNPLNSTP
ncbi:MAG: protein kinase, partial [Actinomycetota bacterium]